LAIVAPELTSDPREALRLERELDAARELELRRELSRESSRVESLRNEAWSWCIQADFQRKAQERLLASPSWRLTRPLRALGGLLRRLRSPGRADGERIALPMVESPRASIVIPVHSQPELTTACLASIAAGTDPIYEVVLADDAADRATKRVLRSVGGARLIVNERNLGFTGTVNRAAAECAAPYIVICNDDIEVRAGWLSALIACAESDPDIAVVVPKYLRPDGKILEAGGIVWSDGGARRVGWGAEAGHAHFNHRREVDYGSAAAMLVRTDFWRDVGGFDERFSPGYWEDTDLCFAARERGLKVMYEPRAEVMHVEGASHGVDESEGIKANQILNAPKFAAKWEAALARQPARSDDAAAIRAAANRARGPQVLLIDDHVPSPDIDSGSMRMLQVIRALISLGCSIRFLPEDSFRWEPYCGDLERLGVEVLYGTGILTGLGALREEFEQIGPGLSLVLISRPTPAARFLQLVREFAPQATLIYDTVDLHYVRERRRAEVEGRELAPLVEALRTLELAMVAAADATFCVSEVERKTIRAEVPDARVEVLSNSHELATEVPPAASREGLLFVGNYLHRPNIDAARYLAEEIMPLVWREAPEAVLRIAGSRADLVREPIESLADERIVFEGWVEDIEALMDRTRALLAPLRYGSGVKGKITHSLARGLPVVTTPVGAEGLGATHGRDLLIAEDAEALARDAVRLLEDDGLWEAISGSGLALAERSFSTDHVVRVLRSLLPPELGRQASVDSLSVPQ
jgi:GT2 family glycosyltransferase/glycosyltransferase involved in cell wall biosynthesis